MFRVFTCTFVIYSSIAKTAWADSSSLVILGNQDVERLPIFSFLVYHGQSGKYLHHNYVSTLLNDLFGIQSRGGCACAGPYAMVSSSFFHLLSHGSDITPCNKIYKPLVVYRFSLFDLILYIPSTIFQLNRDRSSWVEPVIS